jgi:hypothetical protein
MNIIKNGIVKGGTPLTGVWGGAPSNQKTGTNFF